MLVYSSLRPHNEVKSTLDCNSSVSNTSLSYFSVKEMSDSLRKRRFQHSKIMKPCALFFRSKLSHPLSPKTPAVLIDLIIKRDFDDPEDVEKSIHFSIYDMTYRHDLDSDWVTRLKCLSHDSTNNTHEKQEGKSENSENDTVTNVRYHEEF